MSIHTTKSYRGFTLIEFSIALIIIGLVIGGILVGQDLIQTAEHRALMTRIENYKVSIATFKLKYGYLPGDIPNATEIWGEKPGADCNNQVASSSEATCDGDNDGQITFVGVGNNSEGWCIWQHLSNANLVDGQHTCSFMSTPAIGDPTSTSDHLPRFFVDYNPATFLPTYNILNKTIIKIRAQGLNWPALKPTAVHYMDMKQDDGLPFKGLLQSANYLAFPGIFHSRYEDCTTSSNPATAIYNISSDEVNCSMAADTGL